MPVSELLTASSMGNNFVKQRLSAVPFAFSFTDYIHFQSYLGEHLFLPTPSVRLFYTYYTFDFLQSVFFPGIP